MPEEVCGAEDCREELEVAARVRENKTVMTGMAACKGEHHRCMQAYEKKAQFPLVDGDSKRCMSPHHCMHWSEFLGE